VGFRAKARKSHLSFTQCFAKAKNWAGTPESCPPYFSWLNFVKKELVFVGFRAKARKSHLSFTQCFAKAKNWAGTPESCPPYFSYDFIKQAKR